MRLLSRANAPVMTSHLCSANDCDKPINARGLCKRHYTRWLREQVNGVPDRIYQPAKGRACIADDCGAPVRCKGMCNRHYERSIRKRDQCPGCDRPKQPTSELCMECHRRADAIVRHFVDEKVCPGCQRTLPVESFPWRAGDGNRWKRRSRCRSCDASETRERNAALEPEEKKKRRDASRQREKQRHDEDPEYALRLRIRQSCRTLGLDFATVMSAWGKRGHACEICQRTPSETGRPARMTIDHDHATGEFRGFLCGSCNTGLGMLQDSPELLRGALDYLSRHATVRVR